MRTLPTADSDRSRFVDALRVYVGLALVVRGVQFVSDPALFEQLVEGGLLPFASTALAHLVGVLHIGGGLLLACGLLTRIAAAAQIPAVAGALLFVHLPQGVSSTMQGLQLTAFVLFTLLVVVAHGPGPWSADHALEEQAEAMRRARMAFA